MAITRSSAASAAAGDAATKKHAEQQQQQEHDRQQQPAGGRSGLRLRIAPVTGTAKSTHAAAQQDAAAAAAAQREQSQDQLQLKRSSSSSQKGQAKKQKQQQQQQQRKTWRERARLRIESRRARLLPPPLSVRAKGFGGPLASVYASSISSSSSPLLAPEDADSKMLPQRETALDAASTSASSRGAGVGGAGAGTTTTTTGDAGAAGAASTASVSRPAQDEHRDAVANPHKLMDQLKRPEINPFDYDYRHATVPQYIKMAVCGAILIPVRLFGIICVLVYTCILSHIVFFGIDGTNLTEPLAGWRAPVLHWNFRILARILLHFCGYYHIKTTGKLATVQEAPILCLASHSTFYDFFHLVYKIFPSSVTRKENVVAPVVGKIVCGSQPIHVDRIDPNSKRTCVERISNRANSGGKWPQLFIFPEGTCTNRKALISFKSGAFIPGVPVQPIALRYTNKHYDPCWVYGGPSVLRGLLFLLAQPVNYLEVQFLPPHVPTEEEQSSPALFANNVRNSLAAALNVGVTEHSYEDVHLCEMADPMGLPGVTAVVEFSRLQSVLGYDLAELEELVEVFSRIDRNHDGRFEAADLAEFLRLPLTKEVQDLFRLFDYDSRGFVDLRDYVIGLRVWCEPTVSEALISKVFR
ncbi:lysophosphatidylcholine acyltransferase 2-B [Capsaspora owczarzaki ATCC 30864]|uniref:Lysophosphatidylcholine acyltransferase 2-B n=1 Tax=Capsaspora owczarzaki (strain ATCC 30864) TaxID=595528 RepID=A0A0D2UEB8_CAPO3|nr:lysophosphatidylcholine acyltransferase 2-B [Capsaspora owczarzaki ATCC 30864]